MEKSSFITSQVTLIFKRMNADVFTTCESVGLWCQMKKPTAATSNGPT